MKKYSKLEVIGEWSSKEEIKSKNVNVSFGSISLNISGDNSEPISQWAYSSVTLVKRNSDFSIFSPDFEESESLKVYDDEAIEHLLSLSQNKTKKKTPSVVKWIVILSFLLIFVYSFYSYHRLVLERLAFSLTSKEQETFIGNLIYRKLKNLNICNSRAGHDTISNFIKETPELKENITNMKLISSSIEYPLLLPGGTLLIPIKLLENEDGLRKFEALLLNSIKLQKELTPIKTFFLNQSSIDLLLYVFGYFQSLKFSSHIEFKLKFSKVANVHNLNISDSQWINIRNICFD